jgi:peptidoglycan/xylan/chitin deacetylase (PgdA/CDA1 family)
MVVTDFFVPVSAWLYIGIVLALMVILTWGSISINSGFYLKSVCFGNSNVRSVSLTFDDGPDRLVTPLILGILKENNVKATFFIVGSKAEKHPDILKRIDADGHIIGGHSYSHHFYFDFFSGKRMRHEMKQTSDIVYGITGKRILLFRPPYGVTNPTIAKALKAMNYLSVGWSLKSNDTVIQDESLLLNRLTSNVKRGDIILFHDNKPCTINILGTFIHYLRDKEYSIERLDKFLTLKAYAH